MDNDYKHIWRQKRSLLNVESHIRMYIDHRDILGNTHRHSIICAYDQIAEEFHRHDDNKSWYKQGEKLLNKQFAMKTLAEGETIRADFNEFISYLQKIDFEHLNNNELIQLFKKACHFHARFRGYFKATRGEFLNNAEVKLKKILANYIVNEDKAQEFFEILTTPSKYDDINKEFIDWMELLQKPYTKQALIIHIFKYPWLVASTYDLNQIVQILFKKYKNDKENLKSRNKELRQLRQKKNYLRQQHKYLQSKFKNPELNYLSWLFRELSVERMRLKSGWAGADLLYFPLYKEIARRTLISLTDLYSIYRINEVIKMLRNEKILLTRQEKDRRKRIYVILLYGKRLHFYSGKRAEKIVRKKLSYFINIKTKKTDIIYGQGASLGRATGKVRVVIPGDIMMLAKTFKQFKSGEILVSTMIQPNMLPIMKKAVAFVTDEGGLTSHAAIVARELGIPCVVGTEIATKVLEDGDVVEVDAIKGIVKKLG